MRTSYTLGAVVAVIVAILVVAGCGLSLYGQLNKNHVRITVRDKATKTDCDSGDCHGKYLIYTDRGVYEDTDSLIQFKFNSSDLYGKLQPGHTYDCTTVGFRIPLLSSYRNLLDCEEVAS